MPIINGRGRVGIRKPASQIVTSGLVFNLDAGNAASYAGTGTTWTDLSGNGYNGTLTNGPTYNSANGGSIVFDGANDFVNLGTSAALKFAKNFTINIWFKFNTKTGTQTIISNNQSGGYGIISNNTLSGLVGSGVDRIVTFFYINGTYYLVGDNLSNYSANIWYNVSATYDGNVIKYYRNGSLIESYGIVGSVTATGEPLVIGANPGGGGTGFDELFNGSVAQVSMYNKALSAAEVLQNYNALKSRYSIATVNSGLVLHLDAGNAASYPGTGTVWTDLSGNGHNGTLINGPTYSSANNGSIVFDGVNDYAEFGDVLDLGTNNATINVWVKINSTWPSGTKWFLTKTLAAGQAFRYGFGVTQTRQLRAIFDGDGFYGIPLTPNTNATLNLNQWYMCTLVIDRASSLQFYLNGVLQSTETSSTISQWNGLNFQTNIPFRVGAYTDANNTSTILNFPGNIAVTQMYLRALSASEITQNYNALRSRYGL